MTEQQKRLAFGATIRALRGMHNMTQPALCEIVETSTVTLRELERGEHNHRHLYHGRLRAAFGVEPAQWRQLEALYLVASQRLTGR